MIVFVRDVLDEIYDPGTEHKLDAGASRANPGEVATGPLVSIQRNLGVSSREGVKDFFILTPVENNQFPRIQRFGDERMMDDSHGYALPAVPISHQTVNGSARPVGYRPGPNFLPWRNAYHSNLSTLFRKFAT